MTQMSSVLSTIGYHRKSAWFMYETLNRMIPLLIQGRAAMASSSPNKKDVGKGDDGILEVLKRICEVYGIGGKAKYQIVLMEPSVNQYGIEQRVTYKTEALFR